MRHPLGVLPSPPPLPLTNCSHKGLSQLPELCSTPHQAHLSPPRQHQPESSLGVTLSTVPPGRSMEVTVPNTLNVLNGSDARLSCTFNSCYTVNHKQFSLNWTYQECNNCSEEMVSPGMVAGDGGGGRSPTT